MIKKKSARYGHVNSMMMTRNTHKIRFGTKNIKLKGSKSLDFGKRCHKTWNNSGDKTTSEEKKQPKKK